MRNILIIKTLSICLLIIQTTTWAQVSNNEKEFHDEKCSPITTVEQIIININSIIYHGDTLPPVKGSLPNGEYIIEVNSIIVDINHNAAVDTALLANGDSVCITAFTYDLETFNTILFILNDICEFDPDFCRRIVPNFAVVVRMFVLGVNDSIPGASGLQEIVDFVDSLDVPDIISISDAKIRLRSLNDFIEEIVVLDELICYAGAGVLIPLPIELKSFTGFSDNCNIDLTWQTATERNFSHFEVEKSHNGIDFYNIGRVASISVGDSDGGSYNYTDSENVKPINYYRLKNVDKDHTFNYSSVIVVKSECADGSSPTVNISPNPIIGDLLFIQLVAPVSTDNVKIHITDQLGRSVAEQYVSVTEGFNQLEINVHQLSPHAIYFLNIQSTEWMTSTERFVKR